MEYIEEKLQNTREEFESLRNFFWKQIVKKCANCQRENGGFHLHHIVPLVFGGTNRISNIRCLCEECHGLIHGIDEYVKHSTLVNAGVKKKREEGKWARGKILFGYKTGLNKGEILINDSEAEAVRLIFKLKDDLKYNFREIAETLNFKKISPKYSDTWDSGKVSRVYNNKVYYGGENYGVDFPPIVKDGN